MNTGPNDSRNIQQARARRFEGLAMINSIWPRRWGPVRLQPHQRPFTRPLCMCFPPPVLPCSRETGFYEQITLVQGLSLFFFDSIFGSVEGVTHLFSAVFLFAL